MRYGSPLDSFNDRFSQNTSRELGYAAVISVQDTSFANKVVSPNALIFLQPREDCNGDH